MKPTLWVFSRSLCSECQALEKNLGQNHSDIEIRKVDGQYLAGDLGLPKDDLGYILGDVLDAMMAVQVQACNEFGPWPPVFPVGVLQNTDEMRVGFGKERILALLDKVKAE